MTGTCQRNVAEGSGHSHKGGDQSCETTVLCVAMKPTHLPLEYTSLRINSDAAKQIVDSLELQIGDAANFFFLYRARWELVQPLMGQVVCYNTSVLLLFCESHHKQGAKQ